MAETLSIVGMVVLIIIGLLIVVLLAYAIRILIIIYSFLGLRKIAGKGAEENLGTFGKFIKSASVVEIILFLLRSRGRFRK